jgi:ABC-type enterochelin transport system permease subunit
VLVECLHPWVVRHGVVELAVVVLGSEVSVDSLADSDEVVDVDLVALVHVEVVLEVLQHVHLVLDEVVSPDTGERERSVQQLPGVHLRRADLQLLGDLLDVVVVLPVEGSGEHIVLPGHLVI